MDDYWPSVIIQFWMILVRLSVSSTRTNNNHPILDDSSHPFLDDVSIHPILDDSCHPFLGDGVTWITSTSFWDFSLQVSHATSDDHLWHWMQASSIWFKLRTCSLQEQHLFIGQVPLARTCGMFQWLLPGLLYITWRCLHKLTSQRTSECRPAKDQRPYSIYETRQLYVSFKFFSWIAK